MLLRSAAIACATATIAALAAPAAAETSAAASARCEATSFRIYFAHGASRLTPAALETIEAAARNVEGCAYAELHIAVDASSPYAARRAAAIRAAAEARGWDAARIAPRMLVSVSSSPDFAEVEMTPNPAPTVNTSAPAETDAGV
jgi:type IV pilus biogenesis protein CpaD/CtpE